MASSDRYYQLLGVEPGASLEEIKRAYRRLASVWHPDRFGQTPQQRDMAEQKMREINAAYSYLQASIAGTATGRPTSSERHPYARDTGPYQTRARQSVRAVVEVAPEQSWAGAVAASCLAVSADGAMAWLGGNGLRGWETASGTERREFRVERGDVAGLCVSSSQRLLFYGYSVTVFGATERREGRICEAATGREHVRLKGLRSRLAAAGFHPTGNQLVTGDASGGMAVWETASGRQVQTLRVAETSGVVRRVAFCAEGRRIVSLTAGEIQERILFWDAKTGALIREYTTHVRDSRRYGQIHDLAPSPDGHQLLVANNDPLRQAWSLHLWDIETDRETCVCEGHDGRITEVAYAPNGRWLLSGSDDRTIRVWDAATGAQLCRLNGASRSVAAISVSADCRFVAGCSADGKAYIWRLPLATLHGTTTGQTT